MKILRATPVLKILFSPSSSFQINLICHYTIEFLLLLLFTQIDIFTPLKIYY